MHTENIRSPLRQEVLKVGNMLIYFLKLHHVKDDTPPEIGVIRKKTTHKVDTRQSGAHLPDTQQSTPKLPLFFIRKRR